MKEELMKVRTGSLMFLIIFMIGLFAFSNYAFAKEFSANFIMQEKVEKQIVKGKIFMKGDKMRYEIPMEGRKQITIVRPDKSVVWMVYPEEKMYMEMPYQKGGKKYERWSYDKQKRAKYLGKEHVSGLLCKKYQLIENGEKTYFWISEKFLFPVKVKHKDGVMEYKNIKEGRVSNSLFEIPHGYKKMSIPAMPGGMNFPGK